MGLLLELVRILITIAAIATCNHASDDQNIFEITVSSLTSSFAEPDCTKRQNSGSFFVALAAV